MDVVNQQSTDSLSSPNYCTRSSQGVTPKKRQSYGDFVEHPKAKRRISMVNETTSQIKETQNPIDEARLKELSSDMALKDCSVSMERLPSIMLENAKIKVQSARQAALSPRKKTPKSRKPRATSTPLHSNRAMDSTPQSKKSLDLKRCNFPGCYNRNLDELFEIPLDEETKLKWLFQLRKKFMPGIMVCVKHFDENDIEVLSSPTKNRMALKTGAVPKKVPIRTPICVKLGASATKMTPCEDSVKSLIDRLLHSQLITADDYKRLKPFGTLTSKDIEEGLGTPRIKALVQAVHGCSSGAYNLFRSAVSLTQNIQEPTLNSQVPSGLHDYKSKLTFLFPNIDMTNVNTSSDLVDVLVRANIILDGVKALVEESSSFPLSILDSNINNLVLKQEVNKFSKIIFLNTPETYNKVRGLLNLPTVHSLFPTLVPKGSNIQIETITLGQLLCEAPRLNKVPAESLHPFGGFQLCPYNHNTANTSKHIITSIFFNARAFFYYLAEYLPIPTILFIPNKKCDSSDQAGMQASTDAGIKKPSPFSSTKEPDPSTETENEDVAIKLSTSTLDTSVTTETNIANNHMEEFVTTICPKTNKAIAKMDIDTKGFLPKDLTVKVIGHTLTVSGNKEEGNKKISFFKVVELPDFVDADLAGCYFYKGRMCIHAPVLETFLAEKTTENTNKEHDTKSNTEHQTKSNVEDDTENNIERETENNNMEPETENNNLEPEMENNNMEPETENNNTEHNTDNINKESDPKLSPNSKLDEISKTDDTSSTSSSKRKSAEHLSLAPNEEDHPRNVAVLKIVDGQEYISLIAELGKFFKTSEISVKARENKTIIMEAKTKSSDPLSKSRLDALVRREFDLPKKIEKTSLKAAYHGEGLLKVVAKVDTN